MDQSQHPDPRADRDDEAITLHHSVHSPRRVDVRIHGARRHSLDPPIAEEDGLVRRVVWYAVMGMLTFMVAFGVAFWVQAKGEYRTCVNRNAIAAATNDALDRLADAAQSSGDPDEAKALQDFRDQRENAGQVQCNRPPFTREYHPGD